MLLFIAVLQAIAGPYALLKGILLNGNTFFFVFIAYYIMITYCHLGQTFINQVSPVWQVAMMI